MTSLSRNNSASVMDEDHPDYMQGLHMAMGECWRPHGEPGAKVAGLISNRQRGTEADLFLCGCYIGSHLAAAALVVKSPGGAGLVFFGVDDQQETGRSEAAVACLNGLVALVRTKAIGLLEALVDPILPFEIDILQQSKFSHLTNLIYLTRGVSRQNESYARQAPLDWVSFSEDKVGLFCEALQASYSETLDCAELSGLRPVEEVLADHRATGIFTPSRWWVALAGGKPAGVVLVNKIEFQPAVEIVYIGVAKPVRGQGVSDALLCRVIDTSREAGDRLVTLAVDARNHPARRMYDRWNFEHALERQAWIAT